MEKLHCPKCQGEHITVHSRQRYFLWAALSIAMMFVSYWVLSKPLLRPGEWDVLIVALIIFCQAAFCISLILAIYFFVSAILKKHTSYHCKECHHQFDHGFEVQHEAHRYS